MVEMKIAVGVVLLGAFLSGSAYAAKSGAPAEPSLNKELAVQTVPMATKSKTLPGKKAEPSDQVGAIEVEPKAKTQIENATEPPPESAESVKLKGVRG
jgi:hypothetical protein